MLITKKNSDKILNSKFLPALLSLGRVLLRKRSKKAFGCGSKSQKLKNHRFFRTIYWEKLEKRELSPPIKPIITDEALAENFSSSFTKLYHLLK